MGISIKSYPKIKYSLREKNSMSALCKIEQCTGCSACASVCPKSAIAMVSDDDGFLRPTVEEERCVDCKLCDKVCPVLHQPTTSGHTDAYAAYGEDVNLLSGSSSGAIFPLLAKHILGQGGLVFGAAFDENFMVKHIGVETIEALSKLCSSKYVQSEIGQIFREAKAALDTGRLVYFSGTPCQIAGLKSYLKWDYENLITQDLICHSAPSPRVWKDYKHALEEKQIGKMTGFSFRRKENGWESYYIRAEFDNGNTFLQKAGENPYQLGFIKGLYSRPSCYFCPFKGVERCSDITLADFWDVKNVLPEAFNPSGTSLVLLHSEKARKLFQEISSEIHSFPADADVALSFNKAALIPTKQPKRYALFWANYGKKDFTELVQYCCQPTARERLLAFWKRSVPYRAVNKLLRIYKQKN